MEKTIDIYAEARRRLLREGTPAVNPGSSAETKRAASRAASRRYSKTEKGKAANHNKCKTWQKAHPKEVYGYVQKFRANFEALYGMKYGTYLYRKKRGLEVPEIKKAE